MYVPSPAPERSSKVYDDVRKEGNINIVVKTEQNFAFQNENFASTPTGESSLNLDEKTDDDLYDLYENREAVAIEMENRNPERPLNSRGDGPTGDGSKNDSSSLAENDNEPLYVNGAMIQQYRR